MDKTSRYQWFNQARFGLFIHWGLYSLLGRGEWVRYHEAIPAADYHALADRFNPQSFRPREWARLARQAGMKYMVLTAKHHDGFCLFDSQETEFTSVKTRAGRDFIAEYAEACRAEGLGLGLYFSVKDWDQPAYFRGPEQDPDGWQALVALFHAQTLELMRHYGPIDILFFDCADDANFRGGWGDQTADIWQSQALFKQIRALQPDILINDRAGLPGDYGTAEQTILNATGHNDRLYESCVTLNNSWGYTPLDQAWKTTETIISQLTACAARGCNYLLNVGPDPDGVIPCTAVSRLQETGEWLKVRSYLWYRPAAA